MAKRASATFTIDGDPVTVHAIRTGSVTVKKCHFAGCLPERTPYPMRFAAIIADRRFADPMPIWTFAIEHPQGVFVVDAGADPSYNDDASWDRDRIGSRLVRSFIDVGVGAPDTLPHQLGQLGIDPADVDAVILTHQHIDHTGSVPAFPNADIWTTQAEDHAARKIGSFPWRWRTESTRIRYVDKAGLELSTELGTTVDLVRRSSLQAIHTPGHTPGSVTVRLRTDQTDVWFTGDTSFTAEGMNPKAKTAGIHVDMRAVRQLQAELADRGVILPSHDPGNAGRLERAGAASA